MQQDQAIENIIFDLDGTLIDSSEGILKGFKEAFKALGIMPTRGITKDIIGPPLIQTLSILANSEEDKLLNELAQTFKKYYDNNGYKLTTEFSGITGMLRSFYDSNKYNMYIATNKRLFPTKKIIKHLGWEMYFKKIYALDSFDLIKNKSTLIKEIMRINNIECGKSVYIGDRNEDYKAAIENNMSFIMAGWGFQEKQMLSSSTIIISTPTDIETILRI